MGHGFGHGAIDFLSWEISSGRLCPRRGSAWWRAVNGLMALDLVACEWALARGLDDQDPVTEAWLRYVVRADDLAARLRPGYLRETQSLFWEAHQRSLHRALEQAAHLFAQESILEQRFIDEVVLPNVDQAALGNEASCLDTIALFTFALYPINPGHYGASKADLQLGRTLTIDRIPLSRCYGRRHQDIGRRSARWSGPSKPLHSPRQARKPARARSPQPPQTDGLTGVRPALT